MAWNDLKASIAAVIKTNGTQAITGALLQSSLNSIIDQVGANSTFKGIAIPSTNPGTPDGPVFYLAFEKGVYSNFGGKSVSDSDGFVVLIYSSVWDKYNIPMATKTELDQLAGEINPIANTYNISKQLFDKENDTLRVGYQATSGANAASDHNIVVTIPRSRIPSDTFTIQTYSTTATTQSRVVFLQGSTILSTVIGDGVSKTTTHVIPVNCDTIKIHTGLLTNVASLPLRDNPLVNTFVLNDGAIAFPHEEYNKYTLKEESLVGYTELKDKTESFLNTSSEKVEPIAENFNVSKQLFDKENDTLRVGYQATSGANAASDHNIVATIPRSRIPSDTFTIQTNQVTTASNSRVVFLQGSTILSTVIGDGVSKTTTHVIPVNCDTIKIHAGYLRNVVSLPLRDNAIVNTFMLNDGAIAFPYEEYNKYTLKEESLIGYTEFKDETMELLGKDILKMVPLKNMLNPDKFEYDRYFSPGNGKIIDSIGGINRIGSGFIEVLEGEWYVVSNPSGTVTTEGGYYEDVLETTPISLLEGVIPVDGIGRAFLVPLGQGIKYVYFNFAATDTTHSVVRGTPQLEKGEQATDYTPFSESEKINPIYLSDGSSTADTTALSRYTDLSGIEIHPEISKIPLFRKHWLLQDKDLVVLNTGTSLTARSNEHTTLKYNAPYRPPLMHSNNYASHIWDALKWESQQYRRYDAKDIEGGDINYFTESGAWQTQTNNANWDDGIYRNGYTRFSDDPTSTIQFRIPTNAWQFNFIFRSESAGTENAVLAITEGDGKVEVWNGSAWVEANGYVFSQKETEQYITNVDIPDARTGTTTNHATYKIGGNTTYQKRLKMRVIDRSVPKDVTISRTDGRLLYWGVEWSEREFMITYINAARGSHNITLTGANSSNCLAHYQENEVWSFKPDLILTENPIHNSGASSPPNLNYPTNYWGQVTEDFFFDVNPVSMLTRATLNGLTPEWVIFTSSISWNFNGINEDGSLKFGTDKSGNVYTALDSFNKSHQYLIENHPEVVAINSVKYWVDAGFAVHGDLRAATIGSGLDGSTFTNEGSHWNNTGSKIIARTVLPILKF